MRLALALCAALGAALCAAPIVARADVVLPLHVEGGVPLLPALPLGARSHAFAALGVSGSASAVGRAEYGEIRARLVGGVVYRPRAAALRPLSLGGELALAQAALTSVHVPPVVDESHASLDLGELRLWVLADARLVPALRPLSTPLHRPAAFVRLTLPSDTSRWGGGRFGSPSRRLLGDAVTEHPYVVVDAGTALSSSVRRLAGHAQLGAAAAFAGDDANLFLGATLGGSVAVDRLTLVLQLDALARLTEPAGGDGRLLTSSVGLGVRAPAPGRLLVSGEVRVGLDADAAATTGRVCMGFSVMTTL